MHKTEGKIIFNIKIFFFCIQLLRSDNHITFMYKVQYLPTRVDIAIGIDQKSIQRFT